MLWSNLIDVLRGSLFVLAHWCGGSLGVAILVASVGTRLALLPVTLGATRRRLLQEQKLRELAPALERIKRAHTGQPQIVLAKTRELHEANGVSPLDPRTLAGSLIQLPPAAALYAAIRGAATSASGFLWIPDLARPDRVLTAVAGIVAGGAAWIAAGSGAKGASPIISVVVSAGITLFFLSHMSAGLALYSITNSVVSVAERAIAGRANKAARA
ncbi:MAG TPA: YidC/Oxa1 family membrane protein insertase [Gemmatimonadaceae bacterium]|nr:YidC/Oxa1 family membrane protein insertase [Gemmatimonadaceae bacterium]